MKKRALMLFPLAAALLLTGCADAGSTAAAAGQLDAQALSEIANEVAGDNEKAVIVDKESLKAQVPLAEKARKAMKVTPESCTEFVAGDIAEELEKMNVVSVSLPGATQLQGVQVGLASYAEPADAAANMAQAEEILRDCANFSFSLQGQETTMGVKPLAAKTAASKTSAIQTSTSAGDITISTVSVNALEGQNVVTVAVMGGTDSRQDIAQAQELADTVLKLVQEKTS
ncbi:sensor domain-containing protein [Arthrobacter sp. UCD-GKA]|uniref:sensor domain-containing protein n=1 Tax=Arthrobacter sp. UCD-GKA TaxID=1913576 RepID=UPI0011136B44|nr:sensor domain-containing protein [Arthrobacter sp. UCD-GKA]